MYKPGINFSGDIFLSHNCSCDCAGRCHSQARDWDYWDAEKGRKTACKLVKNDKVASLLPVLLQFFVFDIGSVAGRHTESRSDNEWTCWRQYHFAWGAKSSTMQGSRCLLNFNWTGVVNNCNQISLPVSSFEALRIRYPMTSRFHWLSGFNSHSYVCFPCNLSVGWPSW